MKHNFLKFNYLIAVFIFMFVFSLANSIWAKNVAPNITINKLSSKNNKNVSFIISVKKTPNAVKAMGFDVVYDPKVLNYSNYKKGNLIKDSIVFEAYKIKKGLIRVGGFMSGKNLIESKANGEIIKLNFKKIKKGDLKIKIKNLQDDISLWKKRN